MKHLTLPNILLEISELVYAIVFKRWPFKLYQNNKKICGKILDLSFLMYCKENVIFIHLFFKKDLLRVKALIILILFIDLYPIKIRMHHDPSLPVIFIL